MGMDANSAAMAAVLVVLSASLVVTMVVVDEKPVRLRAGSDGDGENPGWSNTLIHRKSSYSECCLRCHVDLLTRISQKQYTGGRPVIRKVLKIRIWGGSPGLLGQ